MSAESAIDWQSARPTCFVRRPYPADWDDKYLERVSDRLRNDLVLLQLDCGFQIIPTDLRFLAHHRVARDGDRWWVDGAEVIEERDAPWLPMAPERFEAAAEDVP